MRIYIGADHRGFKLKEILKTWLISQNYKVEDMGAYEYDPNDDYTLYAEKVASIIKENNNSKGVLLCGSGVGVDVVANKFDGVRASIGKEERQVKAGRKDDDMNILVLAADFTAEDEAKKMIKAFLNTKFGGKARHTRRLEDIKRIEENN